MLLCSRVQNGRYSACWRFGSSSDTISPFYPDSSTKMPSFPLGCRRVSEDISERASDESPTAFWVHYDGKVLKVYYILKICRLSDRFTRLLSVPSFSAEQQNLVIPQTWSFFCATMFPRGTAKFLLAHTQSCNLALCPYCSESATLKPSFVLSPLHLRKEAITRDSIW